MEAVVTLPASRMDWESLRREPSRLAAGIAAIEKQVPEPGRWLRRPQAIAAAAALCASLAQRDAIAAAEAAQALAGLGEGRTPAGDDFLVGGLYALHAYLPPEIAGQLAAAVVAAAVPRTTTFSAQWLRAAASGEAIPAWRELLAAVAAGDADGMTEPLQRVIATGHSSGLVSLAGFAAAGRALLEEGGLQRERDGGVGKLSCGRGNRR